MAYEIRAMSFTEILDGGFRIVRDHALVLLAIPFVLYLPLQVGMALVIEPGRPPEPSELGALAGVLLLFALAAPIASAALIHAVGEAVLGSKPEVGDAFRVAMRRLMALVGTSLLWTLIVLLGTLLLVIPGIYAFLAYLLVFQIVVLERKAGFQALKRSHELMKGSMAKGFGIVFLSSLIAGVVQNALGLAFGFVPFLAPVAAAAVSALALAYTTAVLVLLYFDRRCRNEAFDLEHLARQVEDAAPLAGPEPA